MFGIKELERCLLTRCLQFRSAQDPFNFDPDPHWNKMDPHWIQSRIQVMNIFSRLTIFFQNRNFLIFVLFFFFFMLKLVEIFKNKEIFIKSLFLAVKILAMWAETFVWSFWFIFCFLDSDPVSKNVSDLTDPDPMHWNFECFR